MEPLALDDINFYPCACRYQVSGYAVSLYRILLEKLNVPVFPIYVEF